MEDMKHSIKTFDDKLESAFPVLYIVILSADLFSQHM